MDWDLVHRATPTRSFDGGDLDCGNGLLLLIRKNLDPLLPGQLLEITSTDGSVEEDLPAWARLTGNELVSRVKAGTRRSYLVAKGAWNPTAAPAPPRTPTIPAPAPRPTGAARAPQPIPPFAVMGIGSWPRPRWMLAALHDFLEGRLSEADFHATADDAVRLVVAAQSRADVVTDGEQRRDNYASFVGMRLENCQLVPLTDLLPYVDDPKTFAEELRALDVPAESVRHPAVFGPLRRSRPIAGHELDFLHAVTDRPTKVALPGPYLLTRTMWLECVSEKTYAERETLAATLVEILRAEIADLLSAGASLVQLDEPILTEVVYGRSRKQRSFMCGALGAKLDPEPELAFAGRLVNAVVAGFPRERLALHVCRGNWSPDETVALAGDYGPLVPLLRSIEVGTYFLELCTPRAGEMTALRSLPGDRRIGVGVVNPKRPEAEPVAEILARAEEAVALFGPERVLLNPDCGFATFADNPIASQRLAEAKLAAMADAATILRRKYA